MSESAGPCGSGILPVGRASVLISFMIPAILLCSAESVRAALPGGMRAWQCVPSAIRSDGADSFRLEIVVNGSVSRVTMTALTGPLTIAQTAPFDFRDDGTAPDVAAGDGIYTAGPLRYDTSVAMRANYLGDADSPAGIDFANIGDVVVTETDGTTNSFLLRPCVGLVRADVPAAATAQLSSTVQISPHLTNVVGTGRVTQTYLRGGGGDLADITKPLYAALPDAMDFLVLLSTSKTEWVPRTRTENYNSGTHVQVKVNWTGTGQATMNDTAKFGSKGKLLAVDVLDAGDRGLASNNLLHELTHTWSAHVNPSLGITDSTGHYNARSSAGSLLGGQFWTANGDGTYTINCNEGRSGAHRAAALDKYMMGLIDGWLVSPVRVYNAASPLPLLRCGTPISDIVTTVTIAQIQALHGQRTPSAASAQRDFKVGFVAESTGRLLTTTEMTFYETFAAHFAKTLAPTAPDPYITFNWAPVTRFFGAGTTWSTAVRRRLDLTGDGSVDFADATTMRPCMKGPNVAPASTCVGFDQDGDGDVDLDDFGRLQRCITAAGATPSTSCE